MKPERLKINKFTQKRQATHSEKFSHFENNKKWRYNKENTKAATTSSSSLHQILHHLTNTR